VLRADRVARSPDRNTTSTDGVAGASNSDTLGADCHASAPHRNADAAHHLDADADHNASNTERHPALRSRDQWQRVNHHQFRHECEHHEFGSTAGRHTFRPAVRIKHDSVHESVGQLFDHFLN